MDDGWGLGGAGWPVESAAAGPALSALEPDPDVAGAELFGCAEVFRQADVESSGDIGRKR